MAKTKRIVAERDAICTTPDRCGMYAVRVAELEKALRAMIDIYEAGDSNNDFVVDVARKTLRDGA